jgi:succinate-semialdehyde dehydrogenase/glutarate-semialdehyde dehydrogenase
MNIQTTNPATGQALSSYPAMDDEKVKMIIEQGQVSFLRWKEMSFDVRARQMKEAARLLRMRAGEYAELMAREMGKPVRQGRSECEKCAWVCEYYAEHAAGFLSSEHVDTEMYKSYVAYRPLGLILAVMPWNYPFWQVFRFAAPALMAGNSCVLKHASNVTGCALAIEKVFVDSGFPDRLFSTLLIPSSAVEEVIEHPMIRGVAFTGSGPAGRSVAGVAARMLKKTVMELGGSDAYLVLCDADLEAAAETCAESRLLNSGQSCISAKRFIVDVSVLKKFEALLAEKMRMRNMGDPLREDTEIGPLARDDLREELHEQVKKSISLGARCLL